MSFNPTIFNQVSEIAKQLSDLNIGSTTSSSPLLYLLPPCLILLAVDLASQYSNRRMLIANEAESVKDKEEIQRLSELDYQTIETVQELQQQLAREKKQSLYLSRLLKKQKNFIHHRERLEAYLPRESGPDIPPPVYTPDATPYEKPKPGVGAPFIVFCERLLLQNKIWKQQQKIRGLQHSLHSVKNERAGNAFKAFCDRLLLTNQIRQQQQQIEGLMKEAEGLHRSRIAAVAMAAQQMAKDVRKEGMIEEFVKELLQEISDCRRTVVKLRAEHEQEITELANEYRNDCRKLAREVERLRLSRESHYWEQELSNDIEEDLLGRLSEAQSQYPVADISTQNLEAHDFFDLEGDTLTNVEVDTMSVISSSTCVGSVGDVSPMRRTSFSHSPKRKSSTSSFEPRRARPSPLKLVLRTKSNSSLGCSPTPDSPSVRLDPSPYVGFSFNPIFFSPDKKGESSNSQSRQRTSSLKVTHADQSTQQPKRVQWKF